MGQRPARWVRRRPGGEVGAAEAGEGKGAAEDGVRAASGKMSWAAEDKGKYNSVDSCHLFSTNRQFK